MAQFGASIQTAQITTGSFLTTLDPFVTGYAGYPQNPGQRNPLGAAYYDSTGSAGTPTTAAPYGNTFGPPGKYRYVRYYSTSNPALTNLTAPAPVYWVDNTFTVVTPVATESQTGGINSVAGLIMPNTTSISGLTNASTTGAPVLQGNFVWICVGGFVSGVLAPASTAAGDGLIGTTTAFLAARNVAGTAPPNRLIGYATTALGTPAAGQVNILVTLES